MRRNIEFAPFETKKRVIRTPETPLTLRGAEGTGTISVSDTFVPGRPGRVIEQYAQTERLPAPQQQELYLEQVAQRIEALGS